MEKEFVLAERLTPDPLSEKGRGAEAARSLAEGDYFLSKGGRLFLSF